MHNTLTRSRVRRPGHLTDAQIATAEAVVAIQSDEVLQAMRMSLYAAPSLRDAEGRLREATDAEDALRYAIQVAVIERGMA